MIKRTVQVDADWCGHPISLLVDICAWPAEPLTWDHPGAPGEIEVSRVRMPDGTVLEFLDDSEMEWIEQRVEQLLSDEGPDHE